MIKILLVEAINPQEEIESRYPPLGLGYLASFLKKKLCPGQIKIKIIDRQFEKALCQFQPHLVGLRCVSQNYEQAQKYARLAFKAGLPVVLGGIHISCLPQSLIPEIGVAVLGEGEMTFLKLIKSFQRKGRFLPGELRKIKGLAFWDKGKLQINPPASLITNLDELPFPERKLLNIQPHTYMFTSRGCPFNCRFCASTRFWNKLRFFSAEYVVAEIEELIKKYQIRFISFYDDLFLADLARGEKIVSLLSKKKLLGQVKFSCNCRADLVTDKVAQLMKRMGVKSVGLGLESGDEQILKFLKGPRASVAQNQEAIETLHRYNILANASFVIGSPQETKKQILKTLNFIKKSDLDFADTYLLTPFPGTPIWNHAEKRGLVNSKKMDWQRLNINFDQQPEKAIIPSEKLSRQRLYQLYKLFQKERRRIALKKFWQQPYLMDLPRYFSYQIKKKFKL